MRIRIALGTAVAVIVVAVPSVLTSLITSDPALAQATRHEAVGSHQSADSQHAVRINDKLMSYSQARQVAQEVTYANAVEAAQQATFYKDLNSLRPSLSSRRSLPRRTPSRRRGCPPPSVRRAVRTTRMPDTSGSSSGTVSTAIRRPAARRRRCSWPGRRRTVKARPTHRESATATEICSVCRVSD